MRFAKLSLLVPAGLILVAAVLIISQPSEVTDHESLARPGVEPAGAALPDSAIGSALIVQATGSDFQWSFRHAGRDGVLGTSDDVPSGRELHLPRGAQVEMHLTSTDYIYSLTAPETEQSEIAVPELVHVLRFRPATPGSFDLLSDPMCGLRFLHDETMGRIVVEPPEDFARWLSEGADEGMQ